MQGDSGEGEAGMDFENDGGVTTGSVLQAEPVDQRTHNSKISEQGGSGDGEVGMDFENGGGVTAPA